MNESNSIEEDVTAFFDLCPVDLMKLCTSVGVKPRERWEGMLAYLTSLGEGSKGDVEWLTRRLSALGALPNAPAAAAASAASSRKRTRN